VNTVAEDEENENEELHNSDEELHNSDELSDEQCEPETVADPAEGSEQESEMSTYVVDLGDQYIYYQQDEDGQIHRCEFLAEELMASAKDFSEEELRKHKRLKTIEADLDLVNVVGTAEEAERRITIPSPKLGETTDIRVHVSSKKGPTASPYVVQSARITPQYLDDLDDTLQAELQPVQQNGEPKLYFTRDELHLFTEQRKDRLAPKSHYWIEKSSEYLWTCTCGELSRDKVSKLREKTLKKYNSADSYSKVLSFAKSFLKFLATTRADSRYQTFAPYLELPKVVKQRKRVTSRIVTEEDIRNVLDYTKSAEQAGEISSERSAQYRALILFGAYTGQRSEATISKLTVGQFQEALTNDKPVLLVDSLQDKTRMSHYVPVHPCVVQALKPLLDDGQDDDELMFRHSSLVQWIKRHKIEMSLFKGHFVFGDLRKFAEQQGDRIEWDLSNRLYILTHGVSGVRDKHYLHPLPEHVYNIYMKYWKDVDLTI
jgi:integrase